MAPPNHFSIVKSVYNAGKYDLKTHEGQASFVDAAVWALHKRDSRWGHLKKSPGQTNIHGHAEDSALYLSDEPGRSQSVDFIAGAGGPDPQLTWQVDEPRYSESDWMDPADHPAKTLPPEVPPFPPRDEVWGFGLRLNDFYRDRGAPQMGSIRLPDGRKVPMHLDFEGVLVWIPEYLRRRQLGESDAELKVLADVEAAWPK